MLAIVFLLVVVIFALSQTLSMSSSNIMDTKEQRESVAALFLAESGLERATKTLTVAALSDAVTNAVCTGITGSFALGEGTFSYPGSVSTPATCGGGGPACASCNVKVLGSVSSAKRTISLDLALAVQNGTTGFGGTPSSTPPGITLTVRNTDPNPAAVVFNLAWRRQGSDGQSGVTGGQSEATECSVGCGLSWEIESSSGSPSVGSMGVFDSPILTNATQSVVQALDIERNYAEVGALFVSTSGANIVERGSYWNDEGGAGGGNSTTGATGVNSGQTNNGALGPSGASSPKTDARQTATNWCWRADTLVVGFSGRTSSTDTLSSFTFGPKALTPVAQLPHPAGDIYSEVWYAANPDYYSSGTGDIPDDRATSYPLMVRGSIGASFAASVPNNSDQMTVSAVTSGRLWPGDIIDGTNRLPAGTIVTNTNFPPDGLIGTYTLSATATQPISNVALTARSTTLRVSDVTKGPLVAGPTSVSGVSISSGPDGSGNYGIGIAQTILPITAFAQGTPGATISVPAGSPLPPLPQPGTTTMVAVHSGVGGLAPGTTVTAVGTDSFTVSAAPTTPLSGATVCGGICAFFNHDPSVNGGLTNFAIVKGSGTTQWAAGFSCLSGVNAALTRPVTSTTVKPTTWAELF